MNLEDGFLADVADCPDDDAPRLVYADWLDDQGQADQAALVRPQVGPERRALLQGRERALTARAAKGLAGRWLRRAPPGAKGALAWGLMRGAVERLNLSVPRLLAIGKDLLRRFPIRSLRLKDLTGLAE